MISPNPLSFFFLFLKCCWSRSSRYQHHAWSAFLYFTNGTYSLKASGTFAVTWEWGQFVTWCSPCPSSKLTTVHLFPFPHMTVMIYYHMRSTNKFVANIVSCCPIQNVFRNLIVMPIKVPPAVFIFTAFGILLPIPIVMPFKEEAPLWQAMINISIGIFWEFLICGGLGKLFFDEGI